MAFFFFFGNSVPLNRMTSMYSEFKVDVMFL